jgi:hypothetical protein
MIVIICNQARSTPHANLRLEKRGAAASASASAIDATRRSRL